MRARARDVLRAGPAERVAPHVEGAVAAGDWAALDVLGAGVLPATLLARFAHAPAAVAAWSAYLVRVAPVPLHAPALVPVLVEAVRAGATGPALQVLTRLAAWHDPADAPRVAAQLAPLLRGPARAEIIAAVLAAIAERAPAARADVLLALGDDADPERRDALLGAVLDDHTVAPRLPAGLRASLEPALVAPLVGRDLERVRKVLDWRLRAAGTPGARATALDVIERAVGHRAARVRLHALRLLRAHGERDQYLRSSRTLLRDEDASTVRAAIRIAAYGGDLDAVEELAGLLGHAESIVREAAHEGLAHLGEAALAGLGRAMQRARPDRRPAITAVVDEIVRLAERATVSPA